jgi:hypothetical protein
MLPFLSSFHHLRLRVTSAASQHIDPGVTGILCFGFPAGDGHPDLVIVWDEDSNDGASATNCIETVLRYLAHEWEGVVNVREALVVERDSAGDFDHAAPDWGSAGAAMLRRIPMVSWQPVKWPGLEPRSREAFLAMFGPRAQAILDATAYEPKGVATN